MPMKFEVEHPTYEETGEVIRFDERDSVFSRETLSPESPEEKSYHGRHPELEKVDRRIREFIEKKMGEKGEVTLDTPLYGSVFGSVAPLGLPDSVDGEASQVRFGLSPKRMASRIKSVAQFLGADLVRIGPLRREWIYTHRGTRPFFKNYFSNPPLFEGMPEGYQGAEYGDTIELEHAHAISLGFRQNLKMVGTSPSSLSDFETGKVYAKSALVAVQLARYIRGLGYSARAHHLRNYCVLVVPVAIDAGMGELGRCGYVINRLLGANFRLSCVTTDMPLAQDKPVNLGIQRFCDACKKCAKNCPPGAIPQGDKVVVRGIRKWKIDEANCLLYWGRRDAACAICQTTCPWTKEPTLLHEVVSFIAATFPQFAPVILFFDDLLYGKKYKQKKIEGWGEG